MFVGTHAVLNLLKWNESVKIQTKFHLHPLVKAQFHCTDFHDSHNGSIALPVHIGQILPKSVHTSISHTFLLADP